MDSYVIHIYRREPERMVGTVEDVEKGRKKSFSSAGELWSILQNKEDHDLSDRDKDR